MIFIMDNVKEINKTRIIEHIKHFIEEINKSCKIYQVYKLEMVLIIMI